MLPKTTMQMFYEEGNGFSMFIRPEGDTQEKQ